MSSLFEHILLFMPIGLVVSLVYNSLRRESLKEIFVVGVKRFLFFLAISAVVGVIAVQLTIWL